MKILVYVLVLTGLNLFVKSENVFAASCPVNASRIKGAVNPTEDPEGFYGILQNDVSMGVILQGIEKSLSASEYQFTKEYSKVVIIPNLQSADSDHTYSFTLTRSAVKLKPNSPLQHNIHMPNLIVTGEFRLDSKNNLDSCIANIEIQNTSFGHL